MKVGNMSELYNTKDMSSHTGNMSSFESTSSDYLTVKNTDSSAITYPISINISFSRPITIFKTNNNKTTRVVIKNYPLKKDIDKLSW